jgi:YVTN family beta-propeller protein
VGNGPRSTRRRIEEMKMTDQEKVIPTMVLFGLLASIALGGPPVDKLYVDNAEGDDLTVVDVKTLKAIGSVKVGEHPHGLAPSPDGHTLYVGIEGTGELIALDTRTDRILWRMPVGPRPNEISITGDGRFVFVPLLFESEVAVVDVSLRRVVDRIKVARWPHNTFASADGRHIYVGSVGDGRITAIDAESRKVLYEIDMGVPVRPIAITKDESVAYTELSELHGFAVVDLKGRKRVRQVLLPALRAGTPKPKLDTYSHGVALTPDERELYVTSVPGNAVYAFRVPGLEQIAKIEVGADPSWLAVDPSGHLIFVSNASSNTVSAIDTESKKVVATIPVGQTPKRIVVVRPK